MSARSPPVGARLAAAGISCLASTAASALPASTASAKLLTHQLDRSDSVVVARDGQIDQVGIAIGIDQGNRGDSQPPAPRESRSSLSAGRPRPRIRACDSCVRKPLRLRYILRYSRASADCIFLEYSDSRSLPTQLFQFLQSAQPAADRAEVGQGTTQPPLGDKRHAAAE